MSATVAIIGAGVVGTAIAAHLTSRGYSVTVIEQFAPGHAHGSSHGDSRLYRRVPFEGDHYAQLAGQAITGWESWNQAAGTNLLEIRGGLDISPPGTGIAANSERIAREQSVPHEIATGAQINARFPIYHIPDDISACFQPSSGVIHAEQTLSFLRKSAEAKNAIFHWNNAVQAITETTSGVEVETSTRTINADYGIISAGAWVSRLAPNANLPTRIIRNVLCWFKPDNSAFKTMPIFVMECDEHIFYGMPTPDGRLKVAIHGHCGEPTDPKRGAAPVTAADTDPVSDFVKNHFVSVSPEPVETVTCLYTELPENEFLIDFAATGKRVLIFSPCSGHGFKFAPTYGPMAERMIETGTSPFPAHFSFDALSRRQ